MTPQTWERRRLNSESVWGEIRKRIEQLDLAAGAAPPAQDLAALWHQRALELAGQWGYVVRQEWFAGRG